MTTLPPQEELAAALLLAIDELLAEETCTTCSHYGRHVCNGLEYEPSVLNDMPPSVAAFIRKRREESAS